MSLFLCGFLSGHVSMLALACADRGACAVTPRIATVDGTHHRVTANGAALCGQPVPARTALVELEPGADFGQGPRDCARCAGVAR